MPGQGIQAKFGGKCSICMNGYEKGDWIDRVTPDSNERAHVVCINGGRVTPSGGRSAPSTPTNAPLNGATPVVREALVKASEAAKEIAAWADVMRESFDSALAALDSHQSHPTHANRR